MPDHDDYRRSKTRLLIMFVLTFTYMLAELIVGYIGKSTSLVADSFHMLSDVIALTVAFIAIRLSPKKWNKSTFGWARAEVLGALVNSVFLIALCFTIFIESIKRFVQPHRVEHPELVFGVGVGGLLVNIIGLFIFYNRHEDKPVVPRKRNQSLIQNQGRLTRLVGADQIINEDGSLEVMDTNPDEPEISPTGQETPLSEQESYQPSPGNLGTSSHHHHDHGHGSSKMNMKGVFIHLLADALGSVIVVISAAIVWGTNEMRLKDENECKNIHLWGYLDYIDPALSTILVILIVISSWSLLQETSLILLQSIPARINLEELKSKILKDVKGVLTVHEFHIWELAGDKIVASIHIVCEDINDYIRITREVKDLFRSEGIRFTTVQAEFVSTTSTTRINPKWTASSNQGILLLRYFTLLMLFQSYNHQADGIIITPECED